MIYSEINYLHKHHTKFYSYLNTYTFHYAFVLQVLEIFLTVCRTGKVEFDAVIYTYTK